MRYWWVNQNQTFRQETEGGYLWSPKRKSNGTVNPFYEFMREVSPGDLVFSFAGTFIRALGISISNAYESPKPPEFGNTGPNWDAIGWRVDMKFYPLNRQIRPADCMPQIRPQLPPKYSPLQSTGRGNESVYLTFVPPRLAQVLIELIGLEAMQLLDVSRKVADSETDHSQNATAKGLLEWEEHLVNSLQNSTSLSETERMTLVLARRGQGKFKENVMTIENQCRITKVDRKEHLRASHIKPWRDCDNSEERLASGNGLLLTPTIDHLFDRGFISFENSGSLLISPAAHESSLLQMGVDSNMATNVGSFNTDQKYFLEYHRDSVFLKAKVSR
jgi:putative restriction endonuclease